MSKGRRYRLRRQVFGEESHCGICGMRVDMDLGFESRMRASVDHIKPKGKYPELEFHRENLQLAHAFCNEAKGDHEGFDIASPTAYRDPNKKSSSKKRRERKQKAAARLRVSGRDPREVMSFNP